MNFLKSFLLFILIILSFVSLSHNEDHWEKTPSKITNNVVSGKMYLSERELSKRPEKIKIEVWQRDDVKAMPLVIHSEWFHPPKTGDWSIPVPFAITTKSLNQNHSYEIAVFTDIDAKGDVAHTGRFDRLRFIDRKLGRMKEILLIPTDTGWAGEDFPDFKIPVEINSRMYGIKPGEKLQLRAGHYTVDGPPVELFNHDFISTGKVDRMNINFPVEFFSAGYPTYLDLIKLTGKKSIKSIYPKFSFRRTLVPTSVKF
jgi:hypothetical protein